ncbi:hypothetical protein STEG23_001941 [Scotinomys teguina]
MEKTRRRSYCEKVRDDSHKGLNRLLPFLRSSLRGPALLLPLSGTRSRDLGYGVWGVGCGSIRRGLTKLGPGDVLLLLKNEHLLFALMWYLSQHLAHPSPGSTHKGQCYSSHGPEEETSSELLTSLFSDSKASLHPGISWQQFWLASESSLKLSLSSVPLLWNISLCKDVLHFFTLQKITLTVQSFVLIHE